MQADLEQRIVRRLLVEWEDCNWTYFNRLLRPVQLRLSQTHRRLGEWNSAERSIAIASHVALERPWFEVLEILKHEMVHQYVDEILGGEDRPHGPLFAQACRARGIDPAATHVGGAPGEPSEDDKIIARVRKLLALAESSNQHEAELAASTAQRLILKFNVDVHGRLSDDERFTFTWVGQPTGRVQAHQRRLAALLIEHFFVQGIWTKCYDQRTDKAGSVFEICGRPENVQMAAFVHEFVARTAERLWDEHKRSRGIRSNRDRRSFVTGAVAGFHAKLDAQRTVHRREGLVWVGDAAVDAFFRRRYPKVRTVRRSESSAGAFADGHSAGRNIVLSRPVAERGGQGPPRALPPKRSS